MYIYFAVDRLRFHKSVDILSFNFHAEIYRMQA